MRVRETIVCEGRYDKNTILQAVDATVVETRGFGVFTDKERLELIRKLGEKNGLIILTDPDGAGFLIRARLKSRLNGVEIKEAYVPDILGKERRKPSPSKEGKLGVEGMEKGVIIEALRRAGATFDDGEKTEKTAEITKADLYDLGLTGRSDSSARRALLLRELQLPERMTANALMDVLNAIMTKSELIELSERLF
ncbi:MAG: DUF4093 domain-containing protein [Oscillospiraceae bacterium]|nr:DUF4093 domain-containing protein [Oscillospiraceae bacterium]